MKTNLTILMMVLISLGGLAQKPQNSPELIHNNLQLLASSPHENFLAKKRRFFERHEKDERRTKHTEFKRTSNLKAAQALPTHQMDSIIDLRWNNQTLEWEVFYREWAEYDSVGNNTLSAWLGADGQTFPDYGGKWEVVWDANNRMIEDTDYDWDFQTKTFLPYERSMYQYDGNGYINILNNEQWDPSLQTWEPSIIDSIFVDASGAFQESVIYSYDTLVSDFIPLTWMENAFDSTGLRTRQNLYSWNIDVWDLAYYTEFLSDEMGRDTSAIDYYFNGSWFEESQKRSNKYDAAGNLLLEASYYWDGESQWIGNNKIEYTHNGANSVTEELSYMWDFFFMKWFINDKITYAHDGNGNLIEEARFSYDTATMAFIPDWKTIYEHDLSTLWSDIALPLEVKEDTDGNPKIPIINKVLGFTDLSYDNTLLKWDTSEIEILKYSPFGSIPPAVCNANFSFVPDQDPLLIYFSDASGRDATSWYWSFGDGTSSTQKNPQHQYASPGTYKISLSTIDATGECTNTSIQQIVVGNTICNAEFLMTTDTAGLMVTTVNTSQGSGLSYFWDFGDGEASKIMSPTHTYDYPGSYTISLTIQNALGTCMDRYSLSTRVGTGLCRADFDVFVDSSTNTARFSAANLNPDNLYRWEFGDGSFETTPKVTKTFTHAGYYSATLKVSNAQAGCVNTKTGTVLIGKKSPGGKAGFIYLSGNGSKVQFNDRSLGDIIKYYWNFGDQDTSTMQNPMHEFVLPGYYSVCLTVINPDGSRNTHCEKIFAGDDTKDQCLARFEYKLTENQRGISCLDRSLGDPDQWKWTYDDGWSSAAQNPSWSTSGPVYLKLQQTIRNSTTGCRDDAIALINMGAAGALKAAFGFVIDTSSTKSETYPVDFIGVSLGDAGKLKWSFGDGTFDSTTINPVHTYAAPGTYEVCLTVTNTTTGEENESCEMVKVGSPSSTNDFSVLENGLKSYPNPFSENTRIEILITEKTEVDLSVYDLMGRKVKTVLRDHRHAGTYIFDMNASDLDAGNYYLILETSYGKARSVLSIVR